MKQKKKRSTVRHTRAIQRARSKQQVVAPPDEQIKARLQELLVPAIAAQADRYRALHLRNRTHLICDGCDCRQHHLAAIGEQWN